VIPVVYSLVDGVRSRFRGRRPAIGAEPPATEPAATA
jgi:hypothetical protein